MGEKMDAWEPYLTALGKGEKGIRAMRQALTTGFDSPPLRNFFVEEMFSRAAKLGRHTDAEANITPLRKEKKGRVNVCNEIFDVNYEIEDFARRVTISKGDNRLIIEHRQPSRFGEEGRMEYRIEGNDREIIEILKEFLNERAGELEFRVIPERVRENCIRETGGFEPNPYGISSKLHSSYSPKLISSMHGEEIREGEEKGKYRVVKIKTREPYRCLPCADPEKRRFATCEECLKYFSTLAEPTPGDKLGPYWRSRAKGDEKV